MAIKYTLKRPFKTGDRELQELTLQRPKTKDFIAVGANPLGTAAADNALLASLTGLPEQVTALLDIEDWARLRYLLARVWLSYFDEAAGYEELSAEEIIEEARAALKDSGEESPAADGDGEEDPQAGTAD